jgi:hypothetical protein
VAIQTSSQTAGEHAGPEARARFRADAEAVAALAHPNIVQVYEFGEAAGLPFFAWSFAPADPWPGASDGVFSSPGVPAAGC